MDNKRPGKALPFIIYSDTEGYTLAPEAEEFLLSEPVRNQRLAIMSICGKYRTGKSFLINKIILEEEQGGFQVGPTVNPCTKGLWLWDSTLEVDSQNEHILRKESRNNSNQKGVYDSNTPQPQDYKVLLIDTEGFGGIDEGENHDSKILLFSLLLSSYLVYNSLGNIDETAIQQLALIINLAKEIEVKIDPNTNEEEDLGDYLPSFMWVVRDFALKLEDSNGTPISQTEYLEKALMLQKGVSDQVEQKNRIRRLLKMFFRDRDCSTLVRPSESEKTLQNLASVGTSELRKEFVEQAGALRKKLFRRIKPKMMNGSVVTGGMLCEMARAYVSSVNQGAVPNIESAWHCLLETENQNAMQQALAQVQTHGVGQTLGMTDDDLRILYKATVMRLFREKAIGSKEEQEPYITGLKAKIADLYQAQLQALQKQQHDLLQIKYQSSITQIMEKLKSYGYVDMLEFQQSVRMLEEQFDRQDRNQVAYWQEVQVTLYSLALEIFVGQASEEAHQTRKAMETHQQNVQQQNQTIAQLRRTLEQEREIKEQEMEGERQRLGREIGDERQRLGREVQEERSRLEREMEDEKESMQRELLEEMEGMQREYQSDMENLQRAHEEQIETMAVNYEQERQQLAQEDRQEDIANLETKLSRCEVQYELQAQNLTALQEERGQLIDQNSLLAQEYDLIKDELAQKDEMLCQQEEVMHQMNNNNNQIDSDVINQLEAYKEQIQKEQSEKLVIFENYQELEKDVQNYKNQQEFYQQQLSDKISLQEELMKAIEYGFSEQDKQKYLVQDNIIAKQKSELDKQTVLLNQSQEKIERQREYKSTLSKAVQLQCRECMQLIKSEQFSSHLCQGVSQESEQPVEKKQVGHESEQQMSQLHLCINQTMVKESADKIPYTEYVIQIRLQNGAKWSVNRKYKHFCQLYQDISQSISNYRFPESAASIIKTFNDINTLFSSKRPTVIEERRTALQTFLRDLLKDAKVRQLKCYQQFLELENVEKSIRFQSQNSHNNSISNSIQGEVDRLPVVKTLQQSQQTQSQNTLHRSKNSESQSFHQQTQPEQRDIQDMIDHINNNVNSNQYIHYGYKADPQRIMKTNN